MLVRSSFSTRDGIGFTKPTGDGLNHQKVLPQGQNLSIFLAAGICLIQLVTIMKTQVFMVTLAENTT